MAVRTRLPAADRDGSKPNGQLSSPVRVVRKVTTVSTATRAATSPALWPPIPSATTHNPCAASKAQQSSFTGLTRPLSVTPCARNTRWSLSEGLPLYRSPPGDATGGLHATARRDNRFADFVKWRFGD